jgi:hypothetical protein
VAKKKKAAKKPVARSRKKSIKNPGPSPADVREQAEAVPISVTWFPFNLATGKVGEAKTAVVKFDWFTGEVGDNFTHTIEGLGAGEKPDDYISNWSFVRFKNGLSLGEILLGGYTVTLKLERPHAGFKLRSTNDKTHKSAVSDPLVVKG